ncbi:MAG: hypothetical protein Q9220_000132 [cf. Caloplaca sp. 1 TL-2023]
MSCSASTLLDLPPEVVDAVAGNLDLTSLCSIRLTCKHLSLVCIGPRFLSLFANQKTDLTSESLGGLIHLANHPIFGGAVKRLTVVAVVYDVDELDQMLSTTQRRRYTGQMKEGMIRRCSMTPVQLDEVRQNRETVLAQRGVQAQVFETQSDMKLLTEALRSFRILATMIVEAAVIQGLNNCVATAEACNWAPVWDQAAKVYRTVMFAIAHSGATIYDLHIYSDVQRCSIPALVVYEHMPALEAAGFAKATERIASLSLSISTHVGKAVSAKSVVEGNFVSVVPLLEQMPNLECLDLHLFTISHDFEDRYVKIFTHIADKIVLPSLRHCKLRGLRCTGKSLHAFLNAHVSIETLEMRQIHLRSGSWRGIFNRLCRMPALQRVALSNIWGQRLINLMPEKENELPSSRNWTADANCWLNCIGGKLLHTRTMSREEIVKEQFHFAERPAGRPFGSLQNDTWSARTRVEYGPL